MPDEPIHVFALKVPKISFELIITLYIRKATQGIGKGNKTTKHTSKKKRLTMCAEYEKCFRNGDMKTGDERQVFLGQQANDRHKHSANINKHLRRNK